MSSTLPSGWHAKRDKTGRIYFANDLTKKTQWEDPRPLPEGWEEKFDPVTRQKYYANHIAKTTQWADPRQPFIYVEEKKHIQNPSISIPILSPPLQIQPLPPIMGLSPLAPLQQGSLGLSNGAPPFVPNNLLPMGNLSLGIGGSNILLNPPITSSIPSSGTISHVNVSKDQKDDRTNSSNQTTSSSSTSQHSHADDFEWYKDVLRVSIVDKAITPEEDQLLVQIRTKLNITDQEHKQILQDLGINETEFEALKKTDTANRECVICYDAIASHIIVPCMHLCLCEKCAQTYESKLNCPKCRTSITKISKTY